MKIDWAALGSVFGTSLIVTVALVGLFTLGIVGLSKRESASAQGNSATLAVTGAYACFAACTAAVSYGIYLIVA
ncbi:hypothetical protein O1Q96_12350 [Streptomyces sp. Qhu-G9]|uniref:hypothetical protein n=1 Tax=Streptomyces sp. Qhu-G9 TaxID=3452799 RepID=UPI0022AC6F9D|nr:hypothetical protein [Streptomyces aurantiacus]WAU80484.1 hypothetical protein O1Q96_12350 [Streptomyces aurantiacus]